MIRIEIKVVIDGDLRDLHHVEAAHSQSFYSICSENWKVLLPFGCFTCCCCPDRGLRLNISVPTPVWCWQRREQTPDYKTDQKKGAKSIRKCWKAASWASNNKHRKIKASPSAKTQPVGETEGGASPLKLYLGQNPPLQNKPSSTVNTNHSQQLREEPS